MENKWHAYFELDSGNQICKGYGYTSQSSAIYAVLSRIDEDGEIVRIPCGYQDLCWCDGYDWHQTHYRWIRGLNKYRPEEYEPEEIEITDRQMRNEYARCAEEMHDDVLATAEEYGIAPDSIEWEANPYDEENPDDFYFCEWDSDGCPEDGE